LHPFRTVGPARRTALSAWHRWGATAALLLRAAKAAEDEEYGLALIISWSLCEQMLNARWVEYLERQGSSKTRIKNLRELHKLRPVSEEGPIGQSRSPDRSSSQSAGSCSRCGPGVAAGRRHNLSPSA
jgi:hypothetical protein